MSPVIMPPGGPDENQPTRGSGRGLVPEYVPVELESSEGKFAISLPEEIALLIKRSKTLDTETVVSRIKTNLAHGFDNLTWDHALSTGDSATALFLLNNLSSVVNSFNDDEKPIIIRDLKSHANKIYDNLTDKCKKNPDDGILELGFYLICKVLTANEHEKSLDDVLSIIISSLQGDYALTHDRVLVQAFERLTYENKTIPKKLKGLLLKTFTQDQWEELSARGEGLMSELHDELTRIRDAIKNPDPNEAIAKAQLNQQDLHDKLLRTRNAIRPDSDDKQYTWEFPLRKVEALLSGKQGLIFSPSGIEVESMQREKLPNNLLFQLEFIKMASRNGFKNWVLHIDAIHAFALYSSLKERDKEITFEKLKNDLGNYFNLRRGNRIPPIRDFLFPGNSTVLNNAPADISHILRFWEELSKIKDDTNSRIVLANPGWSTGSEALPTFEDDKGTGILLVGYRSLHEQAFQLNLNKLIVVKQWNGMLDYHSEKYYFNRAIEYSAQNLADNTIWGEENSVGIPILENEKFEEFIAWLEEKYKDESKVKYGSDPLSSLVSDRYRPQVGFTLIGDSRETVRKPCDFIVVTKADDLEENEEELDPDLTDVKTPASPLVLV